MRLVLREDDEEIVKVSAALQNEVRLQLIAALYDGDYSLNELYNDFDISDHRSSVHRHLEKLREAGIVEKYLDQSSDEKTYRLREDGVEIEFAE
jgi:DNA-binding transcriptional ArsR family regulator